MNGHSEYCRCYHCDMAAIMGAARRAEARDRADSVRGAQLPAREAGQ